MMLTNKYENLNDTKIFIKTVKCIEGDSPISTVKSTFTAQGRLHLDKISHEQCSCKSVKKAGAGCRIHHTIGLRRRVLNFPCPEVDVSKSRGVKNLREERWWLSFRVHSDECCGSSGTKQERGCLSVDASSLALVTFRAH